MNGDATLHATSSGSSLRLLFVIKGSALNRGMNTGIENLAWGLAERGYEVHILAGGTPPSSHGYAAARYATYHFTGGDGSPLDLLDGFHSLVGTCTFDVVIGWIRNIAAIAALSIRDGNRPLFLANEGSMSAIRKPYGRAALRRLRLAVKRAWKQRMSVSDTAKYLAHPASCYKSIFAVVCISGAVKENVQRAYGFDENQL